MEPTAPLEEGAPLVPFVKAGVDPEVAAIKQLLKLLDKAAKSARTYGTKNPVAQRFFQQFYDDLTSHLATHSRLPLLCLLYTSPSPRDRTRSRMPSSA